MDIISGADARGDGLRIAIAVSRFNHPVVSLLEKGCLDALAAAAVADDAIELVRVPGAFELPMICERLATDGGYDAVIALGAVIRGETPHFDFVSDAAAHGLLEVGLATGVPVIFGVLTTDNPEQAFARADPEQMDKGGDAARAALEMVAVTRSLDAKHALRGGSDRTP